MNKKTAGLSLLFSVIAFTVCAQVKKPAAKKPVAPVATAASLKAAIVRGETVYATNCLVCHQQDGGGVPGLNAPLIKTAYVLGDKTRLINIVLKGMQGVVIDGEKYANVMPSLAYLSDKDISDVLTYVRNSFGNRAGAVTAAEVLKARK